MNDVQSKLLEIAKIYIGIVEKLNLRYFAICGTALGSVRHNGFIPWDDDMDFAMPRADYEIFVKKAKNMLPKGFFLQTKETDKNYFLPFCKIRNSNTTFIEAGAENIDINHGIWIDIFPMDGLPSSIKKRKFLQFVDFKILKRRTLSFRASSTNFKYKFKNFLIKVIVPSKTLAYKCSKKLSTLYDYDTCEYFWINWGSRLKGKGLAKSEFFNSFVYFNFEGLEVRVPFRYDEYLTAQYGNWHELPPKDQRNSGHFIYKMDLTKSYKEYRK